MKSKIRIVFLKELREMLRERRTLMFLLAASLIYPAIIGLVLNQMIERNTRTEREGIEMLVIGGAKAPTLMAQLRERSVTVTEAAPMNEDAIGNLLRAKKTVAVLRVTDDYVANYQAMRPARIELWYDSASDRDGRRDIEDVAVRGQPEARQRRLGIKRREGMGGPFILLRRGIPMVGVLELRHRCTPRIM